MHRVIAKKILASITVLTLLSSEIGAAQLAPSLSPAFMRPPGMSKSGPVPYLPPQRAKALKKTGGSSRKSLLADMGLAANRRLDGAKSIGSQYLSRPARNFQTYQKALAGPMQNLLARPRQNAALYREALRTGWGTVRIPSISLPGFKQEKKFFQDVWEGIAATFGGFSGLGALLGFLKPQSAMIAPIPIPAGHSEAVAKWLGLDPKSPVQAVQSEPLRDYRTPSSDYNRNVQLWNSNGDRIYMLVQLLQIRNQSLPSSREWTGIWTQTNGDAQWPRERNRIGTQLPRFATFYLREVLPDGSMRRGDGPRGSSSVLVLRRLVAEGYGAKSRSAVFAFYVDYEKGKMKLKYAEPLSNGRIRVTMLNNAQKEMEVRGVEELSPLVFDLDGDGVRTGTQEVRYDLDGDGRRDVLNDISTGDAVLVFDADGNGISGENGKELFGDLTDLQALGAEAGYRDGFASLAVFSQRAIAEGVLAPDALEDGYLEASELALLEKSYGLKAKVGSLNASAVSLDAAGIIGISISEKTMTRIADFDGQGNSLTSQEGATFTRKDGTTGSYGDIWFNFISGAVDPSLST